MKKYGTKFPEFQQINLDTAKELTQNLNFDGQTLADDKRNSC